ncbi:MAG: hypothetical protein COB35_01465 [Gammaproteobacteria bacterium]|nr:MAG: hypothetical protein COB35_01465 [Gammaproteobacteria bacterium]
MKAHCLDVSDLAPPEPMSTILTALAQLPAKHYLKIIHSRIPYPLLTKLDENGWNYRYCPKQKSNNHEKICLFIYRSNDQVEFEAIPEHLL